MLVNTLEMELSAIAKTHGTIYDLGFGEVAYTDIIAPKEYILETSSDDKLRFYLYRKRTARVPLIDRMPNTRIEQSEPTVGVWEYAPSTSTIAKEGLPTSEELIKWRVALGAEASTAYVEEAAEAGTNVHRALEDLYNGNEVNLAERSKKERWCIMSGAHFFNDLQPRAIQTEQIVGYDNVEEVNGRTIRVLYAGTVDLICEIWNPKLEKWEIWLIDYKTSKEAYMSHRIQVLGYARASVASGRIPRIDRIGILLLGKKTVKGYQLVDAEKLGAKKWTLSFSDFLNVYYNFMLINGGNLSIPSYKVFPLTLKVQTKDDSGKNTKGPKLADTAPKDLAPAGGDVPSVSKQKTRKKNVSAKNSEKAGEQTSESVHINGGKTPVDSAT